MRRLIGSIILALVTAVLVSAVLVVLTPVNWGLAWGGLPAWGYYAGPWIWIIGMFMHTLAWLALFDPISAPMGELIREE